MEGVGGKFHEICNELQKISMESGSIYLNARQTNISSMSVDALRQEYAKCLKSFERLEEKANNVGRLIKILKIDIAKQSANGKPKE